MPYRIQYRTPATDEAPAGAWEDDPRRFETEDVAEQHSWRIKSVATLETRIVEED